MNNAALAGIAIGLTAALSAWVIWEIRQANRLRTDCRIILTAIDDASTALLQTIEVLRELDEYRDIEQAEREAGVDFAVGYDRRIEPFERFLEDIP